MDYSGFANALNGGSFAVYEQGNNQLVLAFTTVPEPGTWALLVGGSVGLLSLTVRRKIRFTRSSNAPL